MYAHAQSDENNPNCGWHDILYIKINGYDIRQRQPVACLNLVHCGTLSIRNRRIVERQFR